MFVRWHMGNENIYEYSVGGSFSAESIQIFAIKRHRGRNLNCFSVLVTISLLRTEVQKCCDLSELFQWILYTRPPRAEPLLPFSGMFAEFQERQQILQQGTRGRPRGEGAFHGTFNATVRFDATWGAAFALRRRQHVYVQF